MVFTNSPVVRTLVLLAAFSTLGAARSPTRFPNKLDNSDLIDLLDAELDESFKLDGALLELTEMTASPTTTPLGPGVDPPTPGPSAVEPSTPEPTAVSAPSPEPTAVSVLTPEPTAVSVSTPEPTGIASPTPEPSDMGLSTPTPSGLDPTTGASFTASPTASPTPLLPIPGSDITASPSSADVSVSSAVSVSWSSSAMMITLLAGVISWAAIIA